MNLDQLPPDVPVDEQRAKVCAALDSIKENIMSGNVTALGLVLINTDGTNVGSTCLLHPANLDPLQIMGLTNAFRVACEGLVFTPFNRPVAQTFN